MRWVHAQVPDSGFDLRKRWAQAEKAPVQVVVPKALRAHLRPDTVDESDSIFHMFPLHANWITPRYFRAPREIFFGYGRRDWSFADRTSFAVMRELGRPSAFTFDSDYRRAGFQVLPE